MGEDSQGNVTETNLRNELDKNIKNYTIESKTDKFKVIFESGRTYVVDANGNVSENVDGWDDIQITNPKVIFNYNGATSGNTEREKQLTYGSTYGTLPTPSKTVTITYEYNGATGGNGKGADTSTFTFGGWYKESSFRNQVTETTQVTITSNHTLYAKWTGGATYNATSSITLYAKWTQNPIITYTVTYNQNTQEPVENMPTNQTKTQGVNLTLSDLVPTRAGYTFNGWSTNISQTETGEYQPGATFSLDTNVTLYAVWKKAGASSIEIAGKATEYYGQIVENYNAKYDDNGTTWRIFMADGDNIYLIADDYMNYKYAPTKNGTTLYQNSEYKLSFNNLYSQYTGASSIDTTLGSKWLSIYWRNYSNSTAENIKAVAYMLDKEIWNEKYKNGYDSIVHYAIGGPTIEMYCKSYKDTHPSNYIEYKIESSYGYEIKWKDGSSYGYSIEGIPKNEFGKIYIKPDTSKANSVWLASPADGVGSSASRYISAINYKSQMYGDFGTNKNFGFCPLVCLHSNVQLWKNPNTGNYRIV